MGGGTVTLSKGIRGDRLRRLRDKRDLSQGQLAGYAGVAQSWISRLERGDASNIGAEHLQSVARVLETSADYLLGRTDDARSPTREPLGDLTPEEEGLIRDYRVIKNEDVKRFIVNAARDAAERAV